MELLIGGAVALFVQWMKTSMRLGEYQILAILMLVSLFAASVYTYLVSAGYWETVGGVIVLASAWYGIVISRFQRGSVIGDFIAHS